MRISWWKFVVIAVAIACWIVGCQGANMPERFGQADATRANRSAPVTIKLSGWTANPIERSLLSELLRDFAATHPGIVVKYEAINDRYMDVIKTRLIGEAAPDVFYLDALEAPFLMEQNVLEPLDKYITPEFDLADIERTLIDSFKTNDRIYGIPKDYSTLALFYDRQAFKSAGLDVPPTTEEELRTYARKLTVRNSEGKIERYGYGETAELARQAYRLRAFGGQIVDNKDRAAFATDESLTGLQSVVDLYRQDRTSAQKSDVGANSGSDMLGQGKVAMTIDGNWAIPYLQTTFPKVNFATAEIPKINNKQGTMAFTVAYVMNRETKHKAEAWQLISALTGKSGMEKWTKSGIALPSRQSVAAKLGYEKDRLRAPFVAGVGYAMPWQAGKYSTTIHTNFDNQFLSVMLGEQPLATAMARAQASANRQIEAME